MDKGVVLIIAIGLSLVTVIADALIKKAALLSNTEIFKWLSLSSLLYLATVVGWFYVLKEMKLSTAGTIYTLSTIIFIVVFSVVFFKEKISMPEGIGLAMAICSIVLLYRFS